ncbi:hypothetical protein LTR60_005854, partial [Cryomyces antarcticus]
MSSIEELAAEWLRLDKDMETYNEIQQLLANHNRAELEKRLRTRIAFGTAGLRAPMQAGFSSMNSLTVIQGSTSEKTCKILLKPFIKLRTLHGSLARSVAYHSSDVAVLLTQAPVQSKVVKKMRILTLTQASQGLAEYLTHTISNATKRGVIIGWDARHQSAKFASLVAAVFYAKGFKILWLSDVVHTPLVPFAVTLTKAAAGVMITASHNPAKDNGYKVYWSNGSQIIPPHDAGIAASILENLEPIRSAWTL